jgi:hypothetical protein
MFTGGEKKSVARCGTAITWGTWKSRVFCFQMISDKPFKKIFKNIKTKPCTVPSFFSLTFSKIQRTLRSGYPNSQEQLQSVGFEISGGNRRVSLAILMNMGHVMSVADADPGSNAFFDHISESLVQFVGLKTLCQFCVADPNP